MNKNYLVPLFLFFTIILKGQVGIGTTSPAASAVLDIQSSSNDKGILIPRMTQAQRNAISSPATGLMIFQTDGNSGFYFYDGSSWDGFGEVKSVNGNTAAANGDVTLTFLATQTGTQAQRSVTSSPTDGLVHIVTGDTVAENGKVYIYSTGLSTWTLSSGFTDTDEQDISGSSFTDATSALVIDIEDGSGQTLSLSALEELVTDSDPSTNLTSASEGDLAYDTTDDELQAYDGTNWLSVNTSAVTPTLDQVTDVGSTTTNGIAVGGLTVNSAYDLPTATGTAGQLLTVSTTTSKLVFTTPATTVTPTLDQVTDVGSTTTNGIAVGALTVNSQYDLPTATGTAGQLLTVSTTTSKLVFTTPATTVTPTLDQVTDVGSTTTNGIAVGALTVNSQYDLPTATGTAGQLLTVSTTTSKLIFTTPATSVTPTLDQVTDVGSTTTNSIEVGGATVTGDLTVNTNTTLEGNTTIGDATSDDITVTARLDSDLVPKTDNARNLGDSALNFGEVNTRNLLSNAAMTVSATGILTLNSSATGTPTISFQQGGTEMAGIGSSTFFIGDSTAGTHYFFPSQGSTIGSTATGSPTVLAFTSTNTLEVFSIDNLEQDNLASVLARGNDADNTINITTLIASNTIESEGTATLASGSTDDDIELGNDDGDDLIINALLQSNLGFDSNNIYDIGTLASNARSIYSRSLKANNNLTISVSSTTDDQILFEQSGTTLAGINSSTFYVGRDSNRYEFPQTAPVTVNNQVLAYTATNSLTFTTIASLPSGTSTGTTLRYNPTSTAWEETELIRYDPTNGGSTTVTISGTLTPGVDNTFSLGTTSNEFSKTYTQGISTNEDYLTLTTRGQNAYLKLNGWGTYGAFYLNGITSQQNDKGNTVIGDDSFTTLLSTPEFNTVLGFQNLNNSSLTGSNNIAIGKSNQGDNVSGSYNISIGVNALAANISSDDLIAIGRQALEKNSTGTENIAIGFGTLYKNIGGDSNLAIGYQALHDATSANNNIAIGKRTLVNLNSSNNTAVGNLALDSSNTGGNNVAIGYNADLSSNSIANGIVIGANAVVTASNTVQLGDSNITAVNTSGVVSATGFNTTGTATITTLTVGDTSKYTLPTTPGSAGQVLTVSTTTSQLVYADPSSTYSPTYMLVNANGSQSLTTADAGEDFQFGAAVAAQNGITITSNRTFNLPSGKIYKLVAYVTGKTSGGAVELLFGFVDGGSDVGVNGIYNTPDDTQNKSNSVPATAIINCISSATSVVLDLKSISGAITISENTYVLIEEL